MMANILEYKGYHTKIEFNFETKTLRGKIEGIIDYIDFECDNMDNVEEEFHEAVDDYLDFCKEVGKNPEKEYKGSFNVRISPEIHKKMAIYAFKEGCSLNAAVEKALVLFVEHDSSATNALVESVRDLAATMKISPQGYANEKMVHNDSNVIAFCPVKYSYRDEVM